LRAATLYEVMNDSLEMDREGSSTRRPGTRERSEPHECPFHGQPGAERHDDAQLTGPGLVAPEDLLEDQEDRGRGAVTPRFEHAPGGRKLLLGDGEPLGDHVDDLGTTRVDSPVPDRLGLDRTPGAQGGDKGFDLTGENEGNIGGETHQEAVVEH